jgi:hypothetical protein
MSNHCMSRMQVGGARATDLMRTGNETGSKENEDKRANERTRNERNNEEDKTQEDAGRGVELLDLFPECSAWQGLVKWLVGGSSRQW